jgi:hypothetical protein
LNHFTTGKHGISAEYLIEFTILEETEIKIAGHEGTIGKIYVPEGTPSHIACGNLFFTHLEIFELCVGYRKVYDFVFPEQGIDAHLVQTFFVLAMPVAEITGRTDIRMAIRMRTGLKTKHRITVSN